MFSGADWNPTLIGMSDPDNLIRKTSVAIQKIQMKHKLKTEMQARRSWIKRCRERELKMKKHDARIGMGYDFKAGGIFKDMTFEKERTLLQLWDIYRNGYSTDQVLNTMYVPIIVMDNINGGRVKCTSEKCACDDTMINELRARYQGIKDEDTLQREQEELARYNELHGISRGGGGLGLPSNLLEAVTGSPNNSRPHSILSFTKDSPLFISEDKTEEITEKEILIPMDKSNRTCPIIFYCCYTCCKTEE